MESFRTRYAELIDIPWQLATGEDLQWIPSDGKRGWRETFLNSYFHTMIGLCTENSRYFIAFNEVMHMVKPPSRMFASDILAPVLARMLFNKIQRKNAL